MQEILKDDFFDKYKNKEGKLVLVSDNDFLLIDYKNSNCRNSYFILDSLNNAHDKYLTIGDCVLTKNTIRWQLECYSNKSSFLRSYWTAHQFNEKKELNLISEYKPFIDSILIKY